MKRENHYMIDIETTGVKKGEDVILQVALVEIEYDGAYWNPKREFLRTLYYGGKPETEFAKKHMTALYKKCNEASIFCNTTTVAKDLREFIHQEKNTPYPQLDHPESYTIETVVKPRYFMGWNASNFDLPFLFDYKILTPSYYEFNEETKKEELKGDAHYRVYEQTGSVQILSDMTGLDRKTIEVLAMDLNPTGIQLPEGKAHDALYDCYKQIIMQNGLIKIGRMGIRK